MKPLASSERVVEDTTAALREKIAEYQRAVAKLPKAKGQRCEQREVLAVLLARDEIARALEHGASHGDDLREALAQSDAGLKKCCAFIDDCIGSETIANWRDTFRPSSAPWWWLLESKAAASVQRRGVLWMVLTAFTVSLLLSLITDITARFLSGGPDRLGLVSTAGQVFLTLLAGSTFTQAGRQWLDSAFASFNIKKKYHALYSFLLAAVILLLIIGFRLSLPLFADYYNERGIAYLKQEKVTTAIDSFERAVALNPGSATAHYHLANSHELLLDYDKALAEYQRAVDADINFKVALNNLARLYILHRSNYQKALDLLSHAFQSPFENTEVEHAAYKNRGWAFFGLQQYALSEEDLRRSLRLSDQAEAHCLLGQTLDAQGKTEDAVEEWARCIELVTEQKHRIEPRLLGQAITGLRK